MSPTKWRYSVSVKCIRCELDRGEMSSRKRVIIIALIITIVLLCIGIINWPWHSVVYNLTDTRNLSKLPLTRKLSVSFPDPLEGLIRHLRTWTIIMDSNFQARMEHFQIFFSNLLSMVLNWPCMGVYHFSMMGQNTPVKVHVIPNLMKREEIPVEPFRHSLHGGQAWKLKWHSDARKPDFSHNHDRFKDKTMNSSEFATRRKFVA